VSKVFAAVSYNSFKLKFITASPHSFQIVYGQVTIVRCLTFRPLDFILNYAFAANEALQNKSYKKEYNYYFLRFFIPNAAFVFTDILK